MRRRAFITLLGGAAAWPLAARAQQRDRVRRVGVLMAFAESDQEAQVWVAAFVKGLRDLGWSDARTLWIAYRWAIDFNQLRVRSAELVGLAPDIILAVGTPALIALRRETGSIPIVFTLVSDPVGTGLIASLAHPGGNITGFANFEYSVGGKWLELLKEVAPAVTRVAVIHNPQNPAHLGLQHTIEASAPKLGVRLTAAGVRDAGEIERAFGELPRASIDGVIVLPDQITAVQRELIIGLVARQRLPAVYPQRYYAISGGMVAYGADSVNLFHQAASYVDRILKGEKPADLPVQQPTRFELVVNLKTAKALGFTIPESFLLRADEVIE